MPELDSILLSTLLLGLFLLEVALFRRVDIDAFKHGRQIQISRGLAALIFSIVTLLGLTVGYLFMYSTSAEALQLFYGVLTMLLWLANAFFFLKILPLSRRLWISAAVGLMVMIIGLIVNHSLVQNLIMLSSLLWLGPVVARQFQRLSPLWIGLAATVFMLVDTYNVFYARPTTLFSDQDLLLNGIIEVGEYSLGIGDIILTYLLLGLTQRFYGVRSAIALAVISPLPRLVIRMIVPSLAGRIIPYSPFIVIPALTIFTIGHIQKQRSKANTKNRRS